jgi:hypothetical protein
MVAGAAVAAVVKGAPASADRIGLSGFVPVPMLFTNMSTMAKLIDHMVSMAIGTNPQPVRRECASEFPAIGGQWSVVSGQ